MWALSTQGLSQVLWVSWSVISCWGNSESGDGGLKFRTRVSSRMEKYE